jgi:hypothetical protein
MTKPDELKRLEQWIGQSIPGSATSGVEVRDDSDAFVVKGEFASPRFVQRPQPQNADFSRGAAASQRLRATLFIGRSPATSLRKYRTGSRWWESKFLIVMSWG